MKKLLVLLIPMILLAGCATPWQVKTTTGYLAGSASISAVNKAFVPPCQAGKIPPDRCAQGKKIYGDTVQAYVVTGDTLILAMTTIDAAKKDELLAQYPILWEQFSKLTADIIALLQQINAERTHTKLPGKKTEIAITPELISIVVAALVAVIEIIPKVWELIQAAEATPADIELLIKMIREAQAALPVWP